MSDFIEIKSISKTFTKVKALSNVNFSIPIGSTHAIVGENGAGKSTLMKIMGGVYQPDVGCIGLSGKDYIFNNVKESVNAGISVIYQELNILSELDVAENIFISQLPNSMRSYVRDKELHQKAAELLESLQISLNPRSVAKELSVSEKQMIEIARAISFNSEIIIMDEPTASLNTQEVDQLFSIIERLKAQGKTILYITHRMKELFEISDDVTVLRDGKYVTTQSIKDVTNNDIVNYMVGRNIENFYKSASNATDKKLLEIKNLSSGKVFQDVSLHVQEGEILGLAGLLGCGNTEVAKAVYGLQEITSGEMIYQGEVRKEITVNESLAQGISFVTDDRKDAGIFKLMGVKQNITITVLDRIMNKLGALLNNTEERKIFHTYAEKLNLSYSGELQKSEDLSGGNQQKLLISRALASECKLLVLLEPTKGVDVGTKVEIYELLESLTKLGMGVLLVTSDLPELISISNRVAVMSQGKLTGVLESDDITEESVMRLATTV